MDIISTFVKLETGVDINVTKDVDNTRCYLGKDIAKIICIRKLDTAMRDFMEEQIIIDDELFITNHGVYKLFFKYDKPICKIFRKWVLKVLKNIRNTGEYEVYNLKAEFDEIKMRVYDEL